MYTTIAVAVDNSPCSAFAEHIALDLALPQKTPVRGVHAYTGKFHEARFRALEDHLPEKYQAEEIIGRQREIHSVLIVRGLELISLEYMKRLGDACRAEGIPFTETIADGKNADVVIGASEDGGLTVMGADGLGRVAGVSGLGSTTRRVLRFGKGDLLIAKKDGRIGSILAGIDGSRDAFAMAAAVADLARSLGAQLTFAACYDPGLHRTVFASLSSTLSREAGDAFRFSEQQQLHNEIIDKSLADLYTRHLEKAAETAREHGVAAGTRLLQGKPYQALCALAGELGSDLIAVGSSGMHRGRYGDVGSNTERVAGLAATSVLVVRSRSGSAPGGSGDAAAPSAAPSLSGGPPLVWTGDAKLRLENVPKFARPMAVMAIERYAREHNIATITPEVMAAARGNLGA